MKRQKRLSLSLFIPLAAVAVFAVACKPSPDTEKTPTASTVNKQIDKAQSAASEATKDLNAYTYAQKNEFVAVMEKQLADLNSNLDELDASIAKATPAVQGEAKAKMAALRVRADALTKQLGTVKNASASTWDTVKITTSKAYDELSESFSQARKWLSEKIAP